MKVTSRPKVPTVTVTFRTFFQKHAQKERQHTLRRRAVAGSSKFSRWGFCHALLLVDRQGGDRVPNIEPSTRVLVPRLLKPHVIRIRQGTGSEVAASERTCSMSAD